MNKLIQLFLTTFLYLVYSGSVEAVGYSNSSLVEAGASAVLVESNPFLDPNATETERRVEILGKYLESFNSPFAGSAETFVLTAKMHNLDWRLLPAITGTESTFGRRTAYLSNNPFGWAGGYYEFESWDESIEVVGKALREKYMDKWGAYTVEEIAPIYAPPSKVWSKNTRFFMNSITEFERDRAQLALQLSI
jgi:hypothetical protein